MISGLLRTYTELERTIHRNHALTEPDQEEIRMLLDELHRRILNLEHFVFVERSLWEIMTSQHVKD